MNDFFNETIWERAWNDDADTSQKKMRKAGVDPANSFDSKAGIFNEQVFSGEGRKRAKRIMNWLEGQGVSFESHSILDIGAASGGFSVPFAERGARVTAVESSLPLVELLKENLAAFDVTNRVQIVHERFEEIDVSAKSWSQAFDLVFVSMCPIIENWESVSKVLKCAKQFCYISMPAGSREHSLEKEIWPLVTDQPVRTEHMEMGYLLHLLYLKGYAYETLITKETQTKEMSAEAALQEVIAWLERHGLAIDEQKKKKAADYIALTYPSGKVMVQESTRYGKVLIRVQDQSMYTREV